MTSLTSTVSKDLPAGRLQNFSDGIGVGSREAEAQLAWIVVDTYCQDVKGRLHRVFAANGHIECGESARLTVLSASTVMVCSPGARSTVQDDSTAPSFGAETGRKPAWPL